MSQILTHLTAVERLASHVKTLPPSFVRALTEDLEYARFGACLADLPQMDGWPSSLEHWRFEQRRDFSRKLIEEAPVAFGLKAAELVSNGALVGTEAGLAFVAGYFTQVCVRRAVSPLVNALTDRYRKSNETYVQSRQRVEWCQSLLYLQDLHGSPLVGSAAIRTKLQVRKVNGPKGIGRGLYELIRVSSVDAFGEAPTRAQMDTWMRGLYARTLYWSSPLARLTKVPRLSAVVHSFYRGGGVDFFSDVERGLEDTRTALIRLSSMIRRGSFTARARERFLELCPEPKPLPVSAEAQFG
jgi:hypothetical protein